MSLSSAKAKLDAQGGDPVTGYISKTDHKESYDELLDDTALTGATTAEAITVSGAAVVGTVNGRDPDDLAKGPASATDNALVRFDGTDGKTVQNSGITVDDNGKVTTDLTVSKATPSVVVDAASAAQEAVVELQTGAVTRWKVGKNLAAESGSDAGSNFTIRAYSDAGVLLSTPLTILRASAGATFSGKVTTTHTSGFEIGSSGPRVMSGTGSPESVVTAPVGSTWIDTAATTGAIKWIKATGTGNTGWVVEYGDTGTRNIASLMTANATATVGALRLRRIGAQVSLMVRLANSVTATPHEVFATLPSGFLPGVTLGQYAVRDIASYTSAGHVHVETTGRTLFATPDGNYRHATLTWPTADAWPASLPGSAA